MSDMLNLRMMLYSADFVRNSRSATAAMQGMLKTTVLSSTAAKDMNGQFKKGSDEAKILKQETAAVGNELMRLSGRFTAAATTSFLLYRNISKMVKETASFQTTLFDINNSLNNFNSAQGKKRIDDTTQAVLRQAKGLYSLADAGKAYYTISTAGLTGKNRLGKDITEMGVEYAKLYHTLSRGKVTIENAAAFIPELLAKTGASMEVVFNNGSTQMERYIDMIGKAERVTKLKMENMRDVLDAMGASMRYAGVGFAEGLAIASVQMNAGQSARTAGQTTKSLLSKMVADSAQLRVHKELYNPASGELKKLNQYNTSIARTQGFDSAVQILFGGKNNFDILANSILVGTTELSTVFDMMKNKAEGLNAAQRGAFNNLVTYFTNIDNLGESSMSGTRQQKRLLLGLSMIFGDGNKEGGYTARTNINIGRETYLKAIQDVQAGKITMFDWYRQIVEGLNKHRGTDQGNVTANQIVRMLFPDEVGSAGFLNILQHRSVQVIDDIYETFEDGSRKLMRNLSEAELKKARDEGRISKTGQIIKYRAGQTLKGIDAAEYIAFSVRDSSKLAEQSYERSLKTLEKSNARLKAEIGTFRVLVGESFLAPFQTMSRILGDTIGTMNEFLKLSPALRSFTGSLISGGAVAGTVYAGASGIQLARKFNKYTGLSKSGLTSTITSAATASDFGLADLAKDLANTKKAESFYGDIKKLRINVEKAKLANDMQGLAILEKQLAAKKPRVAAYESLKAKQMALETKITAAKAQQAALETKTTAIKRKFQAVSLKQMGSNLLSFKGLALMAASFGLINFGIRGMMKDNTFGMQELFGQTSDGRNGRVRAGINAFRNSVSVVGGMNVGYDQVAAGIHDKGRYDKYRQTLIAARNDRTTFFNRFGSQLFAGNVISEGRKGNTPDSAHINNLMSIIGHAMSSKRLTVGMLSDTIKSKADWESLFDNYGIKGETKEGFMKILENKTRDFAGMRGDFTKSEGSLRDLNRLHGEELAKQRNPMLFALYKMLGPIAKHIHSIALGVGGGLVLGALFKSFYPGLIMALGSLMVASIGGANSAETARNLLGGAVGMALGGAIGSFIGPKGIIIGAALGGNVGVQASRFINDKLAQNTYATNTYNALMRSDPMYEKNTVSNFLTENAQRNPGSLGGDWSLKGVQLTSFAQYLSDNFRGYKLDSSRITRSSGTSVYHALEQEVANATKHKLIEEQKENLIRKGLSGIIGSSDQDDPTYNPEYGGNYLGDILVENAKSAEKNTIGLEALTEQLKTMEDQWYFDMSFTGYEASNRGTMRSGEKLINLDKKNNFLGTPSTTGGKVANNININNRLDINPIAANSARGSWANRKVTNAVSSYRAG